MASKRARWRSGDDGAQVVEFALIVPVLMAVLLGILGGGLLFFTQITMTQAAREGARLAAICNQDTACLAGVPTRVQDRAPGITISSSNVTVTPCPATINNGTSSAQVVVTYTLDLGFPPFDGLTLTGKANTPCGG